MLHRTCDICGEPADFGVQHGLVVFRVDDRTIRVSASIRAEVEWDDGPCNPEGDLCSACQRKSLVAVAASEPPPRESVPKEN